jgi:hypothetical protein
MPLAPCREKVFQWDIPVKNGFTLSAGNCFLQSHVNQYFELIEGTSKNFSF